MYKAEAFPELPGPTNKEDGRTVRTLQMLLVALSLAAAPVVHAEIVDQILATVDTEAILQSEIMMEITPRSRTHGHGGG